MIGSEAPMENHKHYAVLGVHPGANLEAIRSAFRQKAKNFHPDIAGGNAQYFIRMNEAYQILSDPARRKAYDQSRRGASVHSRWWWPGSPKAEPDNHATQTSRNQGHRTRSATASNPEGKPSRRKKHRDSSKMTRIMSLAVPRSGMFKIQNVTGDIRIVTTTRDNLWETTRKKFNGTESARLARHVIQVKVGGVDHHVRRMKLCPTEFGAELRCIEEEGTAKEGKNPTHFECSSTKQQISLEITIPEEMTIDLHGVSGTIVLGSMKGRVMAKVLDGILRAGQVGDLNIQIHGNSRAFIANAQGNIDLLATDRSRIFIGGNVQRLRAVLEQQASADLTTTVNSMKTQVLDQASLNVKGRVGEAHYDTQR